MRSVIFWLVWMVYWILLAAGTPSFFPDWLQAATWAAGGTGAVLLIAWAKHVEVLNTRLTAKDEDLKRLEAKITELEKQLVSQLPSPTQPLLEPVSVVEVSEVSQETPRLLPAGLTNDPLDQTELKIQALKMANKLYGEINKRKQMAEGKFGSSELVIDFLYKASELANIPENRIYKSLLNSLLSYYNEKLHDTAVELKSKIRTPFELSTFPSGKYTNPRTLKDLEDIALDLRKIASSPREIY
jgi:hypothetical protein